MIDDIVIVVMTRAMRVRSTIRCRSCSFGNSTDSFLDSFRFASSPFQRPFVLIHSFFPLDSFTFSSSFHLLRVAAAVLVTAPRTGSSPNSRIHSWRHGSALTSSRKWHACWALWSSGAVSACPRLTEDRLALPRSSQQTAGDARPRRKGLCVWEEASASKRQIGGNCRPVVAAR